MRTWISTFFTLVVLGFVGCTRHDAGSAKQDPRPVPVETRQAEEPSANSAARKAGSAAYQIAEETRAVAKKAGRKLKEASREASEGWKEAKRKDKAAGDK